MKTEICDVMKQKSLTLLSTGYVWCLWGSRKTLMELPILEVVEKDFGEIRSEISNFCVILLGGKDKLNLGDSKVEEPDVVYLKKDTVVQVDIKEGLHLVQDIDREKFLSAIESNNLKFFGIFKLSGVLN